MYKFLPLLFTLLLPLSVCAQEYGGIGVGYSEACRTRYSPSFAGGDCIKANAALRGFIGFELDDYFAVELSLDSSFDGGHIIDAAVDVFLRDGESPDTYQQPNVETNRWSIGTLGLGTFFRLPVSHSFTIFAGPTIGGSYVDFDYDVKYFGDNNYSKGHASEFGLNYGWAGGVDIFSCLDGCIRLQWQNWRSLDANIAKNNVFNSNTFTINWMGYF